MATPTPRHKKRKGLRWAAIFAAMAIGVTAAIAGAAFADNFSGDSDLLTSTVQNTPITVNLSPGGIADPGVGIEVTSSGVNHVTFPVSVTVSTSNASGSTVGSAADSALSVTAYGDAGEGKTTVHVVAPAAADLTCGVTNSFSGKVTFTSTAANLSPNSTSVNINVNVQGPTCAPADSTAPTIAFEQSPDGNSGWFKTAPASVKVTATDTDDGGVASLACKLDGTSVTLTGTGSTSTTKYGYVSTSSDGDHTVACEAADSTGNTAAYTDNTTDLKLDTVAPTISDDGTNDQPTGNDGTNDWYDHDVTVNFSASDGTSGLASTCPSSWTADTSGEGTSQTASSGSCSDVAGNTKPSINSSGYHVDETDPTVAVTGVSEGQQYTLGSVPAAGCNTTDSLSGVRTEATLSTSGGPVGAITATCSGGEDYAGNTAADVVVHYSVIYNWTGFFQPVNNLTDSQPWNSAKAGSAIPVKFNLGGNQGTGILTGYPKIVATACPNSTATVDPIETYTSTAGGSTLTYDTTAMQYIYAWKTDKAWAGKCFVFQLGLNDGTTHNFQVQFTK